MIIHADDPTRGRLPAAGTAAAFPGHCRRGYGIGADRIAGRRCRHHHRQCRRFARTSPVIARCPAHDLQPDSDLGARLVTHDVGELSAGEIETALNPGAACARKLLAMAD